MTAFFWIIVLIVSISILAFYFFNFKSKTKEGLKDLYLEGLDYMMSGHRQRAYRNFKRIIDSDSNNFRAYLRLGQVTREGGNPTSAIKIHRSLLVRKNITNNEKVELYKNLALDYFELKNIDKAYEYLESLLLIDKDNVWAIFLKIKILREKNDWNKAGILLEKYFKAADYKDDNKRALYKIQEARSFIENKNFEAARRVLDEALSIDPGLAISYYFIGDSYSKESDEKYKQGEEIRKKLQLSENNSHPDIDDYYNDAKKLLSKSIDNWVIYTARAPKQSWLVIHLLMDALLALNRFNEFENILQEILDKDPNNMEVTATLADIYDQEGKNSQAMELIDKALASDNSSLLIKLTQLKLQSRNPEKSKNLRKQLDSLIHFLVTDKGFQLYKDTDKDKNLIWLYDSKKDNG
jgi:lipopolysaccharide biosynthesis regulator YciM